jgi:hypothetical protein
VATEADRELTSEERMHVIYTLDKLVEAVQAVLKTPVAKIVPNPLHNWLKWAEGVRRFYSDGDQRSGAPKMGWADRRGGPSEPR